MRALIVDDSPVIRVLLQRILSGYGECELAKDGREGIDAFNRSRHDGNQFDVVCLDLGLPVIPGADVLRKIRFVESESASPVRSRIIVITASSGLELVDTIRRQGADGFLVKPIERNKVLGYLESFGFRRLLSHYEKAVQSLEEMCDLDAIPASVLAQLIPRMSLSMGRQLSELSPEPAAPIRRPVLRQQREQQEQAEQEQQQDIIALAAVGAEDSGDKVLEPAPVRVPEETVPAAPPAPTEAPPVEPEEKEQPKFPQFRLLDDS